MRRALFLDRDGVVSEPVWYDDTQNWEAARRVDDLRLIPGAADALRRAHEAGWLIFLVTNQPDWAKGKTTRENLLEVEAEVERLTVIDRAYLCFHHPEAVVDELRVVCSCRKPGTKSLTDAARDFNVDLSQSWMAGDRDTDLLCGRAAGTRVALILHPTSAELRGRVEPDATFPTVASFVDHLLEESA